MTTEAGTKSIDIISISAARETDKTHPPFANQVRALGAADAMILHFYYISPSRVARAIDGDADSEMRLDDKTLFIETEPLARVAIPLTAATQLVSAILQNLSQGMPELRDALSAMESHINKLNAFSTPKAE